MATDKFYPISLKHLLELILKQYDAHNHILGIPRKLFYSPKLVEPFSSSRFGQLMETPIGVAAGPHTQLSQNIVAAWLTGARFIELKTVQTLDELEIGKPCIDMQDEGYNCEWSQELKIQESFDQYLDAWIIIHVLKDLLGIGAGKSPGVIFNMSVGYNLEGILNDNVQWFFSKMSDASAELKMKIKSVESIYPNIKNIDISPKLSDNITLSTMHGCPPDEIEKIGHYLLSEKKLHTAIKLNPTLIGKDELHKILKQSGFDTIVPDIAFDHDLKYPDAISIINNLQETASKNKLQLTLKLTNTLESVNHKDVFSPNQEMMYMSGRALHPISVNLAAKLQMEFDGQLDISFCGGADSSNISELIGCGFSPVTVCSDLLKPGGYGRFSQYIDELRLIFDGYRATGIDDFIVKKTGLKQTSINECIKNNLNRYAKNVLESDGYRKTSIHNPSIKTQRSLGLFDCIHAPCEDTCPTNQDIPSYNYHTANCNLSKAGEIILQTNPFAQTTGMICDHLCQQKCTRINYDSPVLIREIKRYVAESAIANQLAEVRKPLTSKQKKKVGVIGAGPSGLSCAYFLAQAGFQVSVYESKPKAGGMVSGVIPSFRLTDQAIENDVRRIVDLGVNVSYGVDVKGEAFNKIRGNHDYLFIGVGAQKSAKLSIDGSESNGVVDPLLLLDSVKRGETPNLGKHVVIIGGGNTAMDVARTVFRLVGNSGKVTIVYRRTLKQMPADLGEILAVQQEGVEIMELTAPERINVSNGRVSSLTCSRMQLGEKDESGRQRPVKIDNSDFNIEVDTIIPAVGQEMIFDFGGNQILSSTPGEFETQISNVFIGGDALRGASTAINAIGDGRKVAQIIIDREGIDFQTKLINERKPKDSVWHAYSRTQRLKPIRITETSLNDRKNFNLVASTLSEDEVIEEANRCLLCDEYCSVCATVCPNMANYTYSIIPINIRIPKIIRLSDDKFAVEHDTVFEVSQPYQILNIANFCNECGNCNTFCPSNGAPYKVKPKVYLTISSFETAEEGYFFEKTGEMNSLIFKSNGGKTVLTEKEFDFVYENNAVVVTLSKQDFGVKECSFKNNGVSEVSLYQAAIMSAIIRGAETLIFEGKG